MAENFHKEYSALIPNIHSELTAVLIHNEESLTDNGGISVYRVDSDSSHELFTHRGFDILYTPDCEVTVELCGKRLHMRKYNILFIAPEIPYRVTVSENHIVPVISVDKWMMNQHFHRISVFDGVLPGFFADAMWGELSADHLLYNSLSNDGINTAISMLITEHLKNTTTSLFIKTHLLMCIFGFLCSQPSSTYDVSNKRITRSEQISKILTYTQDNYRTVTLEKLATHFHYTVPYVSKLIKSATGLTFTEILREIKFDVCRSLLLNSDLKINRIAEVAGFQNTDHFNRVFKKHMGITPTEFKKKKSIDN